MARPLPWARSGGPVLALLASLAAPSLLCAQTVQGRVLDEATAQGIASALVELVPYREAAETVGRVVADSEGRFVLRAPSTGSYRLRASRIGYQTVTTDGFDLVEGEPPLEVELRVGVEAVPLAPMHVLSDRPARLHPGLYMRGFYERRRTWGQGMGFGHFFDREDIERRNPFVVSDMLQGVPGVRMESHGGARQITLRSVTSLSDGAAHGRRCVPTIFVDGAPATSGDGLGPFEDPVDILISVADLVGVEVYPGLTAPAQFIRGACGAVVFWTGRSSGASIADLQEAAARSPASFSLELRAGPGVGHFVPTASGLHWAPRTSWSMALDWRLFPRISLYGAVSRTPFGCERELCEGRAVRFLSRGVALGFRGDLDVTGGPWLQMGVVRHRLRMTWEESGEPRRDTTSSALGMEGAAGLRLPLGERFALVPGVRLVRYSTPQEVRLLVLDVGVRVRF